MECIHKLIVGLIVVCLFLFLVLICRLEERKFLYVKLIINKKKYRRTGMNRPMCKQVQENITCSNYYSFHMNYDTALYYIFHVSSGGQNGLICSDKLSLGQIMN